MKTIIVLPTSTKLKIPIVVCSHCLSGLVKFHHIVYSITREYAQGECTLELKLSMRVTNTL